MSYTECKKEHLDYDLTIWPFRTSCVFIDSITMGYHRLPYAFPYIPPYFYEHFAPFLLVTTFSTSTEVLLNFIQYIFSKISA